jgi:hypothetical protein
VHSSFPLFPDSDICSSEVDTVKSLLISSTHLATMAAALCIYQYELMSDEAEASIGSVVSPLAAIKRVHK